MWPERDVEVRVKHLQFTQNKKSKPLKFEYSEPMIEFSESCITFIGRPSLLFHPMKLPMNFPPSGNFVLIIPLKQDFRNNNADEVKQCVENYKWFTRNIEGKVINN